MKTIDQTRNNPSLIPSLVLYVFGFISLLLSIVFFLSLSETYNNIFAGITLFIFSLIWAFTNFTVANLNNSTKKLATIIYWSYIPSILFPLSLLGLWRLSKINFKSTSVKEKQTPKIIFVSLMALLHVPFNLFLSLLLLLSLNAFIGNMGMVNMGKTYLNAVVSGNIDKAISLAHDNESCIKKMQASFINDSLYLKNAEIRKLDIQLEGGYFNGGGLGPLNIWMVFEYQSPNSEEWVGKKMYLFADDIKIRERRDACGTNGDPIPNTPSNNYNWWGVY